MKDRFLNFEGVPLPAHLGGREHRLLIDAGWLLFIWLALLIPCMGHSEEDRIVAVVGGEEITQSDLAEEIADYGKNGSFQDKFLTLTADGKQEILDRLVKERLLYRAALDEGVRLNPEDAKRLERLKRDLLVKQYVREVLEKRARTDGELYDYYLKHSDQFSEPEKRNIRHIVVKTREQAEGLRAKLEAGEDVGTLAKEHNIDGTKDRAGELSWVTKGVMVLITSLNWQDFEVII